MKKILLIIAVSSWFFGCQKDDTSNPIVQQSYSDFIKNTEWVGTLDGTGFQYPPPCSLKFNSDNTFTMYSIFVFFPNGEQKIQDSIVGNIISLDSLPDGRTRINTDIITSYNGTTTKTIYITNRNELKGISSDESKVTFQLSLFPEKDITSVHGTWRGKAGTATDHFTYAYPDLSTVIFQDNVDPNVTYYTRGGQPVLLAAPNVSLQSIYQQKGARIYFGGCNETRGTGDITIIPYFGVLLPTGDKMMVHSLDFYARLPNYINTNEPYGPNGVTPVILRD
tara:strand:- start:1073 stop:1912 length:840 start_codon:yes stop_codon:yes gene_type:complete